MAPGPRAIFATVRALIISPAYRDPASRGKLHALAGLGCAVTVAVPGGTSAVDGAVRVVAVPAGSMAVGPERQGWSRRALRALLRDLRPDLVHVEAEPHSRAAMAASAAARRLGIPLIAFSWESVAREYPWLARRRRRAVLGHAAGVIGGNRLAEGLLRAAAPTARHAAIPPAGVSVPAPLEVPPREGLAIGCIGRLLPERGVDQLLRACNHVHGAWTLSVLGTGPEQESLEELAQRFGQASRLRWLGGAGREAIERLWREIDVLVVPSRATATWVERYHPLLVEAMALGLPVVVADTGALPELVGEAGIVASDPEAMGIALQQLLIAPDERLRRGAAARQRVLEHLSHGAIAERTLSFWRTVVPRGATPPAAG